MIARLYKKYQDFLMSSPFQLQLTYLGGAGRIRCSRCTAKSKRTGLQCGRPSLRSSPAQKCQFHGGASSGPKTTEGKARIAAAHWKHGRDTLVAKASRSTASAQFLALEDSARVLGMVAGPRTRGRKPRGYVPVTSIDGVLQLVLATVALKTEPSHRRRAAWRQACTILRLTPWTEPRLKQASVRQDAVSDRADDN